MMRRFGEPQPSVFHLNHSDYRWLRPSEIVSNPQFVVGGMSRFDAKQGQLDDCCLCASISTLTLRPDLLDRVVPQDQGFDYGYAGTKKISCIFHFRFWHFGEWVDVVIDDRLPTINGSLIFIKSEQKNEFWSALLEKAYAKLWGTYEALCNRCVVDIMEDLTGGVTETFYVDYWRKQDLHKMLFNAHRMGALINGVIHYTLCLTVSYFFKKEKSKLHDGRGLIRGHAYSITDFAQVNYFGSNISLIRLRNPWGTKHQWSGPFGDKSTEWNYVLAGEREKLLVVADDGEFW
uniref:Calpain catalytic domain-containing protein n=1 Tax=Syphacia muris TaxID=451379 RepID=A0A0N5ALK5_9BILA